MKEESHSSGQDKFETVLAFFRSDRDRDGFVADRECSREQLDTWLDKLQDAAPKTPEIDSTSSKPSPGEFIETLPEMVMLLGDNRTIKAVNDLVLDRLDYSENGLVGEPVETILDPESVSTGEIDRLVKSEQIERRDVNLVDNDGQTLPVTLSFSSKTIEDNSDGCICLARERPNLREIQQELRREKNRFEAIYDRAPVGLWEQDMSAARDYVMELKNKDIDNLETYLEENPEELREIASRIETLSVNQRLLDILGARNRDHLLQNLNNVFTEETYSVFLDEIVKFFEEGDTRYRNEVDVQTVDGESRTVLFSLNYSDRSSRDWSWVLVTYRDITKRKRVQRELAKNEERFRQLTENINSIFWIQSLETGENLYVSPAVEEVTGLSRRVFIRDSEAFLDMVHPEDYDRVAETFRTAQDNQFLPPGDYDQEYRIITAEDEVRWLHDRAFPVRNDEGVVYRVAGLAEDITERKRMERKLQNSLDEKKTLLQEVHHRVKNNMQIVSSLLRLQSYQVPDDGTRKYFTDCQHRVRSMVLVHERLYQSDQLSDINVDGYLRDLVDELTRSYTTRIDPRIEYEIDEELNLVLDDTIACGLIVNELISNSIEHGFDQSAGDPRIHLEFKARADKARLRVADNGVGPPEDLDPSQSNSLGLQLIDSITSTQLDGDYEVYEDGGTVVEVEFEPKSNVAKIKRT